MWRLADEQLDEFIANGKCEFLSAYAQPFSMLVIADLLGVPEEDHRSSATCWARRPGARSVRSTTSLGPQSAGLARRQVQPPTSRTAARARATTC